MNFKNFGVSTPVDSNGPLFHVDAGLRVGVVRFELCAHQTGASTPSVKSLGSIGHQTLQALKDKKSIGCSFSIHNPPTANNFAGVTQSGFSKSVRFQTMLETKRCLNLLIALQGLDGGSCTIHLDLSQRSPADIDSRNFRRSILLEEKQFPLVDGNGQLVANVKGFDNCVFPEVARKTKEGYPEYKFSSKGEIVSEQLSFVQYYRRKKRENPSLSEDDIAILFYKEREQEVFRQESALSHLYSQYCQEAEQVRQQSIDAGEFYRKIRQQLPPNRQHIFNRRLTHNVPGLDFPLPGESTDTIRLLEENAQNSNDHHAYYMNAYAQVRNQALNHKKNLEQIKTANQYTLDLTREAIVELALYCRQKTTGKPFYISIENVEQHTKDLVDFVVSCRKLMAEKLVKHEGFSFASGLACASNYLFLCLDIGHLQCLKEVYKGLDFNGWIKEQVISLAKTGLIGNVHAHSPGLGATDEHHPLNSFDKELLECLFNNGYNGQVVIENNIMAAVQSLQNIGLMPPEFDYSSIPSYHNDEIIFPETTTQEKWSGKWNL